MLDFEDVTPRKKSLDENKDEIMESAAEEIEEKTVEDAESAEVSPEGAEASMKEEIPEKEPIPQPSVREYHYEEQVKKAPKKKKGWARFLVGCLVIGIAGGGSIGAGYGLIDNLMTGRNAVSGTPTGIQKASSGEVYSATEIVKAVKPSVVSVSTKVSGMTNYWGAFSIPYESEGAGSGGAHLSFVFSEQERRLHG